MAFSAVAILLWPTMAFYAVAILLWLTMAFYAVLQILQIPYIFYRFYGICRVLSFYCIFMDTDRPHRPHTPPYTSASDATRDERLQVQTLRDIGWSYSRICKQLNLTRHQIAYTATHRATPKKRKGRPPALNQEELNRIIEWICAS
jgi:Homeodomain-like domain